MDIDPPLSSNGPAYRRTEQREGVILDYVGEKLRVALESLHMHTGRALGATPAYRALLESILRRARAKTYHHGADYWRRLWQFAQQPINYGTMETRLDFAQRIREQHQRKPAFWAAFEGTRR